MTKQHPSLKAMAENKVDGIQKATYFKIDNPYLVEFEDGFNLREAGPDLDAHLESLYQAMKGGAAVPPIDVSIVEGRIVVRDGHCRTMTARRLVDEGVPYILEARQFRGNEIDSVYHMLGSAQGKPLTPLESGRGFLRLIKYGLKVADICRQTGLSRTTVDNGVTLAEAPVAIQQLISSGQVSVHVALDAIAKHGAKAIDVLTALVSKADASGAGKVTKKHVAGPKVPQKIVHTFISAAAAIRKTFADSSFDELMAMDDEAMIPVPAKELKALFTAHASVVIPTPVEEEL